ncbi:T9SS type B sorting domain-containing protein [Winogradskyella bathintestinalis]|uniref:Gliding motility-associated C-terminal domain-containing protein n=1 Tax=Winogradskyella bathintestinalis TaxID=3035208 RepID=A0ABT7ZWQ2_9FLAO|nr:gliding motility-associated C-terminal domain-containing protein [Winogradskyella bathintestinalis]MDN3493442.1 gliding motility-associated C-terminal domain-containing protein [Winogradskyella bathintestinalis]
MKSTYYILCLALLSLSFPLAAQDIALFQQFNGRYDYTAIGNTLNTLENGISGPCTILTSSSADLNLNINQNIIAAYLYWAGSGNGDLDISLNGIPVSAERNFSDALDSVRVFFAAFADVTDIITEQGNTTYTVSDLDLNTIISPYCPTGTNFGGWAMTIIYQEDSLSLNQLNVYDGLQSVPDFLSITLDNLNVLDNEAAKIGFVAWEGDRSIAVNEQLTINGNVISNYPLNPANNAFNGTNSFTGANNLYNMDIDVYNIQDNISIGDTSATIALTSGQDFVMINNIITVLNSQLPDATISIENNSVYCGDNSIEIFYSVNNFNSTDILPAHTPIAFYSNGVFIGASETINTIAINESESYAIILHLPEGTNPNVTITAIADDDGTQNGVITESNENNNSTFIDIELLVIPETTLLPNLVSCNEGYDSATFNLFEAINTLNYNEEDVAFYRSLDDLDLESSPILIPSDYTNLSNPETVYVRLKTQPCYEIFQLDLIIENCPPKIPQGFSPNGDTYNDWFNIQGLYDIFTAHELQIYNRYGELIFIGNNAKPWFGEINQGLNNKGSMVPVGTYFYVLNLNDPNYTPFMSWVYVNY